MQRIALRDCALADSAQGQARTEAHPLPLQFGRLLPPSIAMDPFMKGAEAVADAVELLIGERRQLPEGGDPQAVEQVLDDRADAAYLLQVVRPLAESAGGPASVEEQGDEALFLLEDPALGANGLLGACQFAGATGLQAPAEALLGGGVALFRGGRRGEPLL